MLKAFILFLITLGTVAGYAQGSGSPSSAAALQGPSVIDLDPPASTAVSELMTIEVVFNDSVAGVSAGDLLINGIPAAKLNEISPRDYVFTFAQPADGTVTAAWSASAGITDLATPPNPFNGGSWTYTLNTTTPAPDVVISEFLANNDNGIKDDQGKRSDWIELFNMGTLPVNLDGWFLSTDLANHAQWRIPAVTLGAKSYLLIWASGTEQTNSGAPLHTNFKLAKEGGYLGLFDAKTNVASLFPSYPAQQSDISYGRDTVDPSLTGFFSTPTPGSPNLNSGPGFALEPVFSLEEGVFTNTSVTVSLSAPAGEIRYTVDGTPPSTNSSLYTHPLSLPSTVTVKARVYQNGLLPSAIIAKNYVLVDGTVANFTSNLPLMIISTSGHGIADHVPSGRPRTFASLTAVDTFRGRSSPMGKPDYFGQCEIGIRGQTSAGFPKKPYRLELQDAYRFDRNASFFGLPSGSDWVLNNPYSDKPFIQNFLAQELFEKMGHYAVRRRFVEVFVNTSGGRISYPKDYAGIYILLEKIKVDEDRVNIAKLTPYDTTEPNISGGYMFKKDKDSAGDLNFSTVGGSGFSPQALKIHEPSPADITNKQLNWIRNYLVQFEKALYSPNWLRATGTNHYSYYIDADSFVDYQWIVEFSKQIDGYRLSNYMSKDRNGKVKMEPIWDWNLSFGNADYADGFNPTGWYYSQTDENSHIWFRRLMFGTTSTLGTTGDPDFNQKIADRWSVLRTNVFAATNVLARVDELASILSEAADRDFKKWPRLGTYIWPNPQFYVTPKTYAGIISAMKNWISQRCAWIDSQFLLAPSFDSTGGRIRAGTKLAISGSAPIYYTRDGSDPRLPGGAISTKAIRYSVPITIQTNTHVIARIKSGSEWSGPTGASFVVTPPSLIITELMYHPAPASTGSAYAAEDFEYLELKNSGTNALDLSGYRFTNGIEFAFPSFSLTPGGRALLVKNRAAFESRYGTSLPIAGEYGGNLDNGGEQLTLLSAAGDVVIDTNYRDDWQPITDGSGFSLVLANENIITQLSSSPSDWRASSEFNGSPGAEDGLAPVFPHVVVSELLNHAPAGSPDKVELQNLSTTFAAIGGWFLTDDPDSPAKYRIPDGTVIAPGDFYVIDGEQLANATVPFAFSSSGESVYLYSTDGGTNLTGYRHGFQFGAQAEGFSFGRYVDSTGREQFVTQTASTFGATNSNPWVPPIVISEIMFHPPDLPLNGALWNDTEDEYVELLNRTMQSVSLSSPTSATNTWRVSGDINFAFPANFTLPPNGYAILVSFDPTANPTQLAAFRSKYNIAPGATILGPFSGHLDNKNGSIKLEYPDNNGTATPPPYILAEQINYSASLLGLGGADGLGLSLHRKDTDAFANDPANWASALPTPGTGDTPVSAPLITEQPRSQTVFASQTLTLNVSATASGPIGYQWTVNGESIAGATNSTLVITNAQPNQSGTYAAIVIGGGSSITSEPARVLVDYDSDTDGILDSWETAYGMDPFDSSDAESDLDGDGISNYAEYMSGTNPLDAQSFLRLAQTSAGLITFTAMPYRTYTLQFSDSLTVPNWTSLTNIAEHASEASIEINDPPVNRSRYYRIVTPSQN
jgi:hypothetical protein